MNLLPPLIAFPKQDILRGFFFSGPNFSYHQKLNLLAGSEVRMVLGLLLKFPRKRFNNYAANNENYEPDNILSIYILT